MKEDKIKNGHIVNIDYIDEITKEHIKKGLALVLWSCGLNGQPLVLYFSDLEKNEYKPRWECYRHIESIHGRLYLDQIIKDEGIIEMEVE